MVLHSSPRRNSRPNTAKEKSASCYARCIDSVLMCDAFDTIPAQISQIGTL